MSQWCCLRLVFLPCVFQLLYSHMPLEVWAGDNVFPRLVLLSAVVGRIIFFALLQDAVRLVLCFAGL